MQPAETTRQRSPVASKKDTPMIPRVKDRLKALEARLLPPPAARVFFIVIEDQSLLTSDEQLAAFKAEKGDRPPRRLQVRLRG